MRGLLGPLFFVFVLKTKKIVHNNTMKRNEKKFATFKWIDLVEPREHDLAALSNEFKITERIILNSMDPEHLPKYEKIDTGLVLYLRVIDTTKKSKIINIQNLTTKITVILTGDTILTLHRLDHPFLADLRTSKEIEFIDRNGFIKIIIDHCIQTFDEPITKLEIKMDEFEEKIFKGVQAKTIFRDGYNLKRKASTFKKVIKFYNEMFLYISSHSEYQWNDFQAEKEYVERMLYYIDDVQENISGVLSLHLSIVSNRTNEASYKTNEIMRVLTVLTIFFLPLNFLAGLYGMNFKYMPELEDPNGYYIVLILMGLISIGIFIWVYRKGWIQNTNIEP